MSGKQAAEQARKDPNIQVVDVVLLSTHYLSLRSSLGKLKLHFIRPFGVTKAVRANTFELELPTIMKVYPLFNITLLHKFQDEYKLPGPINVYGEV